MNRVVLFIVVGAAYATGSQLAYSWFGADGTTASFFPAAGVTLAALILVDRHRWPVVLVAAASAELALDLIHGIDLLSTLGYVGANLIQPLVGVLLLRAVHRRAPDLRRTGDLAAFLAFGVVAASAVGALLGASTYVWLDGGTGWLRFAGEWWVGDGLGVLVIGGAILAVATRAWRFADHFGAAEAALLMGGCVGSTLAAFRLERFALAYVPVALLIGVAFRVGTAGVALTGAAVALIAGQATAAGYTLWEELDVSPAVGVLYLQLALAVIIATALALAAAIHERALAALAWADAESARRESAAVAARTDRLRRLAAALNVALTPDDVTRTMAAHQLQRPRGVRDGGSDDEGDDLLTTAYVQLGEQAYRRAQLYEAERLARHRSELLERHAAHLAAAVTVQDVAASTVAELEAAGLEIVGVEIVRGETMEALRAVGVNDAALARYASYPITADTPGAEAARTGRVVTISSAEEYDRRYPGSADLRREHPAEAFVSFPLRDADGRVIGTLSAAFRHGHALEDWMRPVLAGVSEQTGLALARALLAEAEHGARRRAELLADSARALGRAESVDEIGEITARALASWGAERAALFVRQVDELRLCGASGLSDDLRERYARSRIDDDALVAEVVRRGEPLVVAGRESRHREPGHTHQSFEGRFETIAAFPLRASTGVIGAIAVTASDPQWAAAEQTELIVALGDQVATALERTQLLEQAIAASERAAFLAAYSVALDQPTNTTRRCQRAVDLLVPARADAAAVYLLGDDALPVCAARSGDRERLGARTDAVIAETLTAGGPWPAVVRAGTRDTGMAVAVPLRARKRMLGALVLVGRDTPGEVQSFLQEIAERTALAIDNSLLYERERAASHTLQLGLLGDPLPDLPGVELASDYRPGASSDEVGGDWYDVFSLPNGRAALVVGDVVGHGLEAAAAMAQLRGAVRALAPTGSPHQVLEGLDVFVNELPAASMATLAYAEVDLASGIVCYACAGHPPPLLAQPDGTTRCLWGGRSAPLGASSRRQRSEASALTGAGDVLVLYTDGLIERRDLSLDAGLDALAATVRDGARSTPEELVERTLAALLPTTAAQDDDVCLVVARTWPTAVPFRRSAPADLTALAPLRHAMRGWLRTLGVVDEDADDVLLAVGEAVANAVEHAYPPAAGGSVHVEAAVDSSDQLLVVVRDEGRWLERPTVPHRGRGGAIMRAVMRDVTVDIGRDGTEVHLQHRVRRAAPA
jgi:serine/threonine-protein kinase RsbW